MEPEMKIKKRAVMFSGQNHKEIRLSDQASIFTAELKALKMALDLMITLPIQKYIIFTGSLSSLVAIKEYESNHSDIYNRNMKSYILLDSNS